MPSLLRGISFTSVPPLLEHLTYVAIEVLQEVLPRLLFRAYCLLLSSYLL